MTEPSRYPVSGIRYPASNISSLNSGFWFLVSGLCNPASDIRYLTKKDTGGANHRCLSLRPLRAPKTDTRGIWERGITRTSAQGIYQVAYLGRLRRDGVGCACTFPDQMLAGQIVDPRLGSLEIVDEARNDRVHLMGVVSVAFHSRKRMGLSGSSTDHVSAFPDRHPCSPYDPDRTSGILITQALERYGISGL